MLGGSAELGRVAGFRNAQTTVLAPTGTIGFMMDCDTTGIEPDLALVKYKKLVGGGVIKIVNNTVPEALLKLGYSSDQMNKIVDHIDSSGTIEGAPGLKPEHLSVFDCSFRPQNGTRSIAYMGHVRMMAAVQPFPPPSPAPFRRRSICPKSPRWKTSWTLTSKAGRLD